MSGFQMFFSEHLAGFHFLGSQEVDLGNFRSEDWSEVNGVVIGLMQGKFVMGLF